MNFSELSLESSLLQSIDKLGYKECTPIQSATIPLIQAGKDISGLAQTGTGKTAAFLIPLMDRVLKWKAAQEWKVQNFVLILVPTRELAEQVQENIEKLGAESALKGCAIYGGTGYDKQKDALRNHVEFVVATPGRLIDLYKEHHVDLKQVRAIVFDEADRMFDMGFKDDMKYILQRVPNDRQFLVFSATLNFDVLNTAYQFGADPVEINISRDQTKADNVRDEILHVGQEDKAKFLLSLLKKHNPKQAIVFSNFKLSVEKIAQFLVDNQIPAMGISSLLTQSQRTRVIEQFKAQNEKNILVATDVAARGLDIKGVDMVINFDLPQDAESYVHRIGRTGRAGAEGQALSLVSDRDVESLQRIQEYLKNKLAIGWLEDSDLVTEFKPFRPEAGYRSRDDRPRNVRSDSGRSERPAKGGPGRRDGRPQSHSGRPQQQGSDNRPQQSRGPRHADANRSPRPKIHPQQDGRHANANANRRRDHHHNGKARPDSRGPRQHQQKDRPRHQHSRLPAKQQGLWMKLSKFFRSLFK